jgi:hypothetical protein
MWLLVIVAAIQGFSLHPVDNPFHLELRFMPTLRQQSATITMAVLFILSCGKKSADTSASDTGPGGSDVAETPSSDTAGSPSTSTPPASPSSAPLTAADVQRWERGMEGELKAVQEASAKMKSARTGEDSLNAMMGVQEMSTAPAGAKAAGVDEERYKFIRSNLSAVVSYLTPPELEGMDTTKMPQSLRNEFRTGREAQLQRMATDVPANVVEALRPRAAELRKKDMELAGARLKGAGA